MKHALMYHGAFERNFASLKPGATSFLGSDDKEHLLPARPSEVDGVIVGYMEKAGKKFFAVRVQYDASDIVLENELVLDPARHMGHGKRFGAAPTIVDDDGIMITLLEDVIRKNPDQGEALMAIRRTLKDTRAKK
jgi:hypothetical protein